MHDAEAFAEAATATPAPPKRAAPLAFRFVNPRWIKPTASLQRGAVDRACAACRLGLADRFQ